MLLTDFIVVTRQSIAGITYHDDFGVGKKYMNLQECDPFYWHPLHLPEHCAEMFADLIRSRVAGAVKKPVRLVKRRRLDFGQPQVSNLEEDIYSLRHYYNYFEPEYEQPVYETEYIYGNENDYSMERFEQAELTNSLPPYVSPYEEMFEFLRQDIRKNPIAPTIRMSNYGPVAMYQQPVSRKSKNMINKIAFAYARANTVDNDDDGYFYGKIEYPSEHTTNNTNNQDADSVRNEVEDIKAKLKKKNKQDKKKKKHNDNGLTMQ